MEVFTAPPGQDALTQYLTEQVQGPLSQGRAQNHCGRPWQPSVSCPLTT